MEHELFHSELKHLVERSSLLDIIKDSPSGENPHRVAAMELIFDKIIDDYRERVFSRVDKSPPADPTVQVNSNVGTTPSVFPDTQPTAVNLPFPIRKSKPSLVQPVKTQDLQAKQDTPNAQSTQPMNIQPEVKRVPWSFMQPTTSRNASNVPDREPITAPDFTFPSLRLYEQHLKNPPVFSANLKTPAPAPRGALPHPPKAA